MGSGAEADSEVNLRSWAHNVRHASEPRQRKLKKVSQRVTVNSKEALQMLHSMLTANVDRSVLPPKAVAGRKWSMVDSGSQPNVADCPKEFPQHPIRESEGQRQGVQYKSASGALIANEGEIDVTHIEADGERYHFTFQNANVHCPIISVRDLVTQDCVVTFHRLGGHILYPSGNRISFVCKDGVFFVGLNVVPPAPPEPGFVRQG